MNEDELPRGLESGSPALFRRTISLSLRRWREEAGLKQGDAARRLSRTVAHISNIETDRVPPAADLEILLTLYGKQDRIPFMRQLLAAARKRKNWWTSISGDVPKWFNLYLGLEDGAVGLESFDTVVVPGLLQTRSYAEAVISGNPDLAHDQVKDLVDLRITRQKILERPTLHISTIIDESVLYRVRGDGRTMNSQLNHLIEISRQPRVDIQVLPFDAGPNPAQDCGTFTLMVFPHQMADDPDLVYVELLTGGHYFEKSAEVAEYRRALSRLHSLAADPEASRGIIKRAMREVT